MRRFLCLLICLSMMALPAQAASRPKYAALTFDDGPSGHYTRRLLEGLAERDVKATFFLCGYRLEEMPSLGKEIAAQGHEIGLHGYSHKNMRSLSRRAIAMELADTRNLLPEGSRPVWLRPPGGCCSDAVRQVAQVTGLSILSWSLDPKDWAVKDSAAITRHILKNIRDGDVILLHDMSDSSVDAALAVIDALKPQGWEFVTVSRLAQLRKVYPEEGRTYANFPPPPEEIK
mgnify:CR=1 FL=1